MSDAFVLHQMGKTKTVLGSQFRIYWDTKECVAKVWKKEPNKTEFVDIGLEFDSELKALAYINGLRMLDGGPQIDWSEIP